MITSLTNKTVKNWMKLKTKKERDAQGLFLVDGRHMTQEALKAGVVETIITTDTNYKIIYSDIKFDKKNVEKLLKIADRVEYGQKYDICLEKVSKNSDKSVIDMYVLYD